MKTKYHILFGLMILFSSNLFSQAKPNEILSKDSLGNPTFIKFKETKVQSSDNAITNFLKKQYNLKEDRDFKTKDNSVNSKNGIKSQKFEQYYKGVKIVFSEIVIVSNNNNLKTINGKGLIIKQLNTNPNNSEEKTLNLLLKKINAKKYAWEDESYEKLLKKETNNPNASNYPDGELVIIDKDLFDDTFEPILAYKFNVYAISPLSNSYYYVDATNGKIILEDAIIKHLTGTAQTRYSGQRTIETQLNGGFYKLRDYSRGSGIETYNMNKGTNYGSATDFTDNDNNWTAFENNNSNKDNAALDAHWGAEKTYDYFFQNHNRNSFDNNGGKIKNYVHTNLVGLGYQNNDNAFWDPTYKRMTYGDGQSSFDALTSIDVIAHEIGHGVCSYTANLVYQNESGALNEGLSDIWGAMVEHFADPTKLTYEIGEEIKLGGGSLRSISNPNSRNQPDTYNGTYWYTGTADHGGVHINSGVLNYWFYLLAEGGNGTNDLGNSFNVNGVGKEKASKIIYRAESVYFSSSTTYSQARLLTIQAAEDLYGTGSIESASTCQSWYAVGVGDNNCNLNIEISGTQNICGTTTSTYNLNYTPSTVSWSTSSNLQVLSFTGNSVTVKPISSSTNGSAIITVIADGISENKTIWIGKPDFYVQVLKNDNYINFKNVILKSNLLDISKQGISYVMWQKISGDGNIYSSTSHDYQAEAYGPNGLNLLAKVTVTNSCGTIIKYFNVEYSSTEDPCDDIPFDGITISTPNCDQPTFPMNINTSKAIARKIDVYNFNGKKVISASNTNSIDIKYLSPGIYIIKMQMINGKTLTKKIIK